MAMSAAVHCDQHYNTVSPQPLFKVHRIHRDNLFKSNGNGSFVLLLLFLLGAIAIDSQQRTRADDIIASVELEEL